MKRPHPILIIILSMIITAVTFFLPPLFPGGGQIEHGFPFPWATQVNIPGSSLPIIGWFISVAEVATMSYSWQYFLVDTAIFTAFLFAIFYSFSKSDKDRRERV